MTLLWRKLLVPISSLDLMLLWMGRLLVGNMNRVPGDGHVLDAEE